MEAEKADFNVRTAKRELSLAQDEAQLRDVVHTLVNNASAGETSYLSVVKTLTEFLSKFSYIYFN